MNDKLMIWGVIFLIISVIIFPTIYLIFSMWWLLTGDMVTRLTFFSTGFITTISSILILTFVSITSKINLPNLPVKDKLNQISNLKKIFKQ